MIVRFLKQRRKDLAKLRAGIEEACAANADRAISRVCEGIDQGFSVENQRILSCAAGTRKAQRQRTIVDSFGNRRWKKSCKERLMCGKRKRGWCMSRLKAVRNQRRQVGKPSLGERSVGHIEAERIEGEQEDIACSERCTKRDHGR